MDIAVVGPGALGLLAAVRLWQADHNVTVGCRDAAGARALAKAGLKAVDAKGRAVAFPAGPRLKADRGRLHLLHEPGSEPSKEFDMVILATKCDDVEAGLGAWRKHLRPGGTLVPFQNGLPAQSVANDPNTVVCIVGLPATLEGPGHSIQTGPGGLHLGRWPTGVDAAVREAAAVLAAMAPTRVRDDMRDVAWTKLSVNACITSLGAMTALDLGDLLGHASARRAFRAIVSETVDAGRADGARFPPISGFRPVLVARAGPVADVILRIIGRKYAHHRSSSLQSLRRGRRTEAHHLNGAIVAAGQRHGVPTPVNAAVLATIEDVEAGREAPGPHLLARLAQ